MVADELPVSVGLLHFGEEPPISGSRGSGTIFFYGCPLGCVFCQNHQISRPVSTAPVLRHSMSVEELADLMLELQDKGAHNISWVTPTHVLHHAVRALGIAAEKGLEIAIVYNSGGYEELGALKLLDGLVDIYMPDVKWLTRENSMFCSGVPNYPFTVKRALEEMWRQVGPFVMNANGIGVRGLLVRHLVLPGGLSDTGMVLDLLEPYIRKGAAVSLMSQYYPPREGLAAPLNRHLTAEEYEPYLERLLDMDPEVAFIQELESQYSYRPDFDSDGVFHDV